MTRKDIKVSAKTIKTIFRWAQSNREIGFICAGRNGVITDVYRLKNIDKDSRKAFVPQASQLRAIRSAIKKRGMAVLCEGHSHPHRKDTAKPSHGDCEFIRPNSVELIVCPAKNEIRGWLMNRDRKITLTQELEVLIVSR